MKRLAILLGLGACTACVPESACDDYADYVCECRSEEYDCNQVRLENSEPDAEQLSDCQAELKRLQDQDLEAGTECPVEGS